MDYSGEKPLPHTHMKFEILDTLQFILFLIAACTPITIACAIIHQMYQQPN